MIGRKIFNCWSLKMKTSCHTLLEDFSMSRKIVAVCSWLLGFTLMLSIRLVGCWVVKWSLLNPDCSGLILSTSCCRNFSNMIFSRTFQINESRAIGRWFAGSLGSLPGFGSVMIVAIFQEDKNWRNLRHQLKIFVRSNIMFSGRIWGPSLLFSLRQGLFLREFIEFLSFMITRITIGTMVWTISSAIVSVYNLRTLGLVKKLGWKNNLRRHCKPVYLTYIYYFSILYR